MCYKWWKEGVVYQIYPRSFKDTNGDGVGDLRGIIEKADYLKNLGVDILWLSPVYDSPNEDNGYDVRDYYKIMKEFGTMSDMDALIDKVHAGGMKLLMDLVVNHTSDEHEWFLNSKKSKDNPYRDYYIWRPGKNGGPPNNWKSFFGGSVWEYDEKTKEYYLHLFSKNQPDLNWENSEVRRSIYKMMHWWLKKGVDGFRMDTINMLSKDKSFLDGEVKKGEKYGDGRPYFLNGPQIHDYLKEMNDEVLSSYDIMKVGEAPGVCPEDALLFVAGEREELDMIFYFDHMDLTREDPFWESKNWKLSELKKVFIRWDFVRKNNGWNSLYLSNHDQPRQVSQFGSDKEYHKESAKMLATLLYTLPGTPFMYQGEEIGMPNVEFEKIDDFRDIASLNKYKEMKEAGIEEKEVLRRINRHSRDNARTPMQWNSSSNAGFTSKEPWIKVNPNYKKVNVAKQGEESDSILNYYKYLIKLRKEKKVFVYGDFQVFSVEDEKIFSYLRSFEREEMLIVLNFSKENNSFLLPKKLRQKEKNILFSNYKVKKNSFLQEIEMRPYEARIYELK